MTHLLSWVRQMNVVFLSLVALTVAAAGDESGSPLPSMTAQELVQAVGAAEQRIRDITVVEHRQRFTFSGTPGKADLMPSDRPKRITWESKGLFHGSSMERYCIRDVSEDGKPASPAFWEVAFNGEYYTQLTRAPVGGSLGLIALDMKGMQRPYIRPFYVDERPCSVAFRLNTPTIEGHEKVGGVWCYRARVARPKARTMYAKLWFAPKYGMAIVRAEYWYEHGENAMRRSSMSYSGFREVRPGIWHATECWIYWLIGKPRDACYARVESVKVNQGIDDSRFTIRFAPETDVRDSRGWKYVVPALVSGRWLPIGLAIAALLVVALAVKFSHARRKRRDLDNRP